MTSTPTPTPDVNVLLNRLQQMEARTKCLEANFKSYHKSVNDIYNTEVRMLEYMRQEKDISRKMEARLKKLKERTKMAATMGDRLKNLEERMNRELPCAQLMRHFMDSVPQVKRHET